MQIKITKLNGGLFIFIICNFIIVKVKLYQCAHADSRCLVLLGGNVSNCWRIKEGQKVLGFPVT